MSVRIDVTQADIDHGRKRDDSKCPIALALTRMGYEDVSVGSYIVWTKNDILRHILRRPTPPDASKFIHDFDNDRKVKPFSFWM